MSTPPKPSLEEEEPELELKVCSLCLKNAVKYTCPRCNVPYCSVDCYRSQKHAGCSETFYKECFMQGLKETSADPEQKEKMMEMLKRAEADPDLNVLDAPDEDDLEERLNDLDLDNDTDEIWGRLTEQERKEFEAMVVDGRLGTLVEVWTPWWLVEAPLVQEVQNQSENTVNQSENTVNQSENMGNQSKNTVNQSKLVNQSDGDKSAAKKEPSQSLEQSLTGNKSKSSKRKAQQQSAKSVCKKGKLSKIPGKPELKSDIPNMSELIKAMLSADVKYNVINILYSYIFICRLHNGEHLSMATESAEDLAAVSEVMGQGHSCGSTREAIQACLSKIQSSGGVFQSTPEFNISLIKDVEKLICDSANPFPLHSVMLALSDVYEIFKTAYKHSFKSLKAAKTDSEKEKLKSEKSRLFQCMKKCEFTLSWVQTYGMALTGLVPELEIEFSILSSELEAVDLSKKQLETEWGGKTRPKKRTLVEEI